MTKMLTQKPIINFFYSFLSSLGAAKVMKRSLLLLLLVILFSVVSVHAATEDFVASMDATFNTCQCYPLSKQIVITNTGDIASTYSLYLNGNGATLAALQTPSFTLEPGQSRYTTLNFLSTCQELGNYPFSVLIQTSLGLEKELKSNIEVQKCKTLQVDALSGNQIVNNCGEARFTFRINNLGLQDEIVDISVDKNVASSVSLSENPVLLAPQKAKDVYLYVATSCDQEGDIPFTASFSGQNSGLHFDNALNVLVHNKDVPVVGGDITTLEFGREESAAEIPLENTGFGTVTYNLFVTQGPSWISIEPSSLTLPGYSVSSFTLVSAPPEDAESGTYNVEVVAQVADTGVTYTKSFTITLPEQESPSVLTGLFSGFSLPMILILVGGLLLLLLIILLIVILARRKRHSGVEEPRSSSKGAKEQRATERKLAALEAREKRNMLREQKRAEKEQQHAEKMMVLEQRRAEKLASREEKRAEKLREREERQAEKERRKQEKRDAKEAKLQERIAARESRILEKENKKRENQEAKEKHLLKNALLKDLRKNYNLVEKEDELPAELQEEKKPWLWIALLVLFLLIAGTTLIWFFYNFFIMYLPFFIIGFIVLIIVLILLSVYWNKKERINRLRSTVEGRKLEKELQKEVTDYYQLIPKRQEFVATAKTTGLTDKERRKEEKLAAKEAKKAAKASRQLASEEGYIPTQEPRSWRWLWITFLVVLLIAAIAALIIYQTNFVVLYWPYFTAGFVILIVLILIIDYLRFGNKKRQEWQYLEKGEEAVVLLSWRKGLTEIYFTVKNAVTQPRLIIKRLKATPLIGLDAEIYQYFEVEKTNIKTQDVDQATFRFKIRKNWLQKNNISEEKVKLYRHIGSKWGAIPTNFVGEDETFMYFEAKTSGFSYFAIGGKPLVEQVYAVPEPEEDLKPTKKAKAQTKRSQKEVVPESTEEETSKLWILWVSIAIILLLLIGFVGYKIMNAQESVSSDSPQVEIPPVSTDEAGIPRQIWTINTKHTLDIGSFFNDPDGDKLVYSVDGNDNIKITFENGIATLLPEKDWMGQEKVTFSADDGEYDPVESNQVRLFVLSQEQFDQNNAGSSSNGTLWLIVVVGIIVLVLIIIAVEYAKKHKEDSEEEKED